MKQLIHFSYAISNNVISSNMELGPWELLIFYFVFLLLLYLIKQTSIQGHYLKKINLLGGKKF